MTTLLIAEHDNAQLKDATHKALSAAAALGAPVHVLVAGSNARAAAEAASRLAGVEKVLLADAPAYEHQLAEPTAALIVSLAGSYDALVAPATSKGKNVMPRVAAQLGEQLGRVLGNGQVPAVDGVHDQQGTERISVTTRACDGAFCPYRCPLRWSPEERCPCEKRRSADPLRESGTGVFIKRGTERAFPRRTMNGKTGQRANTAATAATS